jgi:hypothetical protein
MFSTHRTSGLARKGRAVATGIAAGALAIAMATGINMGILGAAGNPRGPGNLGGSKVLAIAPAGDNLPIPPTVRAGQRPSKEPREGPVERGPTEPAGASVRTPASATPTWTAGSTTVSPAGRSGTRTWSPPPAAPRSPEGERHRFGANNDD